MLKFGTDGVRGKFGVELTESYAANLVVVVAEVLGASKVLIGHDTRESGVALETAITSALTKAGVKVGLLGVAPTPAIAFAALNQDTVSISITASHNLYYDNGIKVFGRGGRKLSEVEQQKIERALVSRLGAASTGDLHDKNSTVKTSPSIEPTDQTSLLQKYREYLIDQAGRTSLRDLHIVLDCANGAFSNLASTVFEDLGAKISTINASP
ncbi:MAG: phosphoglucosamine mutase, partial [Actinomycetota bacterium]